MRDHSSGKSKTLLELAKQYDSSNPGNNKLGDIIYMVFNKSMEREAQLKGFPSRTMIKTIHGLAYRYTAGPMKLQIDKFIDSRSLTRVTSFQDKVAITETLEDFFISKFLNFEDFLFSLEDNNIVAENKYLIAESKLIMQEMRDRKRECTHGFYLKLFHKILNANDGLLKDSNGIDLDTSLVLFDEAQDAAPVALEIFKLLKAKQKVSVGDHLQNIYGFMKTVSIFDEIKDAKTFSLTQSFRVSTEIAKHIESFCRAYIDDTIIFKGIDIPKNTEPTSRAYLARTNAELIELAIEYYENNKNFNLTRDIMSGFDLPLAIISAKKGEFLMPRYKFLEEDYKAFKRKTKRLSDYFNLTFTKYLSEEHSEDPEIKSACSLISRVTPKKIIKIKEILKNRKLNQDAYVTLSSVHSSKGNEFCEVVLTEEVNNSIDEIVQLKLEQGDKYKFSDLEKSQQAELYLYYVGCSRAKQVLNNAIHLIGGE